MWESIHNRCEGSAMAASRDRWRQTLPRRRGIITAMAVVALLNSVQVRAADQLAGRAVLPADTFAAGPTSGQQLWQRAH
jgi:hypothetical protein